MQGQSPKNIIEDAHSYGNMNLFLHFTNCTLGFRSCVKVSQIGKSGIVTWIIVDPPGLRYLNGLEGSIGYSYNNRLMQKKPLHAVYRVEN